jgi:hypothetical protein
MSEIHEAKVLRRAKELCEQDGMAWEPEFDPPLRRYSRIRLTRVLLDEARRREYLVRAREQLLAECDT